MKTKRNPWAAVDAIIKQAPEPTGPGWFTVADFTVRYGGSYGANSNRLRNDKRFEKWTGIAAASRRITTKYRLK